MAGFLAVSGCSAQSVVPVPRPAPAPMTPAQARLGHLRDAFSAADRGRWSEARQLAASDPLATEVIRWRALVDSHGQVDFDEATAFLKSHPGWPAIRKIRARAELAMPATLSASGVVSWFAGQEPITAQGEMRLGQAEARLGQNASATRHICAGWVRGRFSASDEAKFAALPQVTASCQQERLDALLWAGDTRRATRQMKYVDASGRLLAKARIAVQSGSRNAVQAISNLPADLRKDPGLSFDRARALRLRGKDADAEAMLKRLPREKIAVAHASDLWLELAISARRALSDNRPQDAYALLKDAGFSPDANVTQYANDEFLTGWIALRKLNRPAEALIHFRNLSREVGRPISLARGAYWQGRALQALGRDGEAWNAYHRAASHPETYYGQLALMRSEVHPRIELKSTPVSLPPESAFRQDEMIRVLRMLAALDQPGAYRTFAMQYYYTHRDGGHALALIRLTKNAGFTNTSVQLAKLASYDDFMFPQYAYPVIDVPEYTGPGKAPGKPLVMALIRQETEFNAGAVSSAGARGLMQIMPKSARLYAARAGLKYHPDRLYDPDYNMRLGMTMVAGFWNNWGGQMMLGAASYNAGPAAAESWLRANGDPRTDDVDAVDWVEQIPYYETRNYVQRVAENVEVYRSRIAGHAVPLQICQDIGMKPPEPLSPPSPKIPASVKVKKAN